MKSLRITLAALSLSVAQVQRAMGKAFSVCYASRFE